MLENIVYFMILGKPLIFYLGIITLVSFLCTATIGFLNFKGYKKIPFKWHPRFAAISIILGIIHGTLGILLYL
ncbi:MAG: hypothetical protein PHD95_00215 [Candidatus ainarchaeum sp.]|nr:hypothetical protein [Candidatus ainarchaeum sp.]